MASTELVSEQIELLVQAYNANPSKGQIKIICRYLEPIEDDYIRRGIEYLIKTRVYPGFPVIGEIIQAINVNMPPRN